MSPFLGTRGAGTNKAFGFAGAAAPNQVTGLTATDFGTGRAYNNGRIDLSWSTPANNGATISGYLIQRSTDGSSYSTLVANTGSSATTYSDTSLLSNQIYYYKVSAINAAGTGTASTASNATSTTVPQAPTVSVVDVGTGRAYNNGAATVTITGGATGGKTISSYTATSSPGSFTATSGSPLTVTGLQSATAYTFSVTATNANGTSTATTSGSITATTIPQAPTIGTATAGNGLATVTYTANATGGKAVSAYTATSSPGSITGTGSSPITISGLTNGTAYTFTVTATNANGTSSASAASNSVTPVAPAFESIASTQSVQTSTLSFSSIPQTYDHLVVRFQGLASAQIANFYLQFNNDSGNNYGWENFISHINSSSLESAGNVAVSGIRLGTAFNNTNLANAFEIIIYNYSSTTLRKSVTAKFGYMDSSNGSLRYITGYWDSASAITSLRITSDSGNQFATPGTFSLYGIKG